ncbi:MAG: ATP synthase F0 subunit B [Planctomycetota bacterium]
MELSLRLVLFETLNFLLLVAILGRFLYRPVREVVARRREELERAQAELAAREAEAARVREEFEARRAQLEREAADLRDQGLRRGEEAAERLLAEAREEARRDQERQREDLERAERRALSELEERVLALGTAAAARVVAGLEQPDLATAYARLGARRLRGELPEEGRGGGTLRVALSPDAQREEVLAALRAELGEAWTFALEEDPALLAGVRLMHHELEVEASADATLRAWLAAAGELEAATQAGGA